MVPLSRMDAFSFPSFTMSLKKSHGTCFRLLLQKSHTTICRFCLPAAFVFLLGCIGCPFLVVFICFGRSAAGLVFSLRHLGFFFCRCFFFSILGSLICCFRLFFLWYRQSFTVFCSVLLQYLPKHPHLRMVSRSRQILPLSDPSQARPVFPSALLPEFLQCFALSSVSAGVVSVLLSCCFFALRRFSGGCAAFCLCCFFLRIR